MQENLKAFVLMPFEPEFNSIFDVFIKAALEEAGYIVARADSFLDQRNILRDIVRGIGTADLVVADITALNPNVLYELGLCHGLKVPTILLAQSMEEVPFDLRSYRIQIYSTHIAQADKQKQTLKEIAEKHKNGEIAFESPITDFLHPEIPTQLTKTTEKQIEEAPEEVKEEKGLLDFIVEGEKAAEKITDIFSEITKETMKIGEKMKGHTTQIQALQGLFKNQRPGTASQAHKIVSTVATDMTRYSENIERIIPTLDENVDILIESFSSCVTWVKLKSEEDREQVNDFRQTNDRLLAETKTVLDSIRSYRDTVADMRTINISKEINRASRRKIQALDGVISIMEKVEAFCVRNLSLIDEKLEKRSESEGGIGE